MSLDPLLTHVNGIESASVNVADRGLAFGDGIFDTLLYEDSQPYFFSYHLDRLIAGLNRLSIAIPDKNLHAYYDQFFSALKSQNFSTVVVKTIVTRGQGRGYSLPSNITPSVIISAYPFVAANTGSPKKLIICQQQVTGTPQLAGIKHLCRLENVLAAKEVQDSNADEGLVFDIDGNLVEAVSSNVFLMHDDNLVTPILDGPGVEGIIKQIIIEKLAPQLKIEVKEMRLNQQHIDTAQEMFLTNSVAGIQSVGEVADSKMSTSKIADKFRTALENLKKEWGR